MCNYKIKAPLGDELISTIRGKSFHIVITGNIGNGKSTLVQQILSHTKKKYITGFYTEKCSNQTNVANGVYIHDANTPLNMRFYNESNRVATETNICCDCNDMIKHTDIFETVGVKLLSATNSEAVVVMDEIGLLESDATNFCNRIIEIFNSKVSFVAVIKKKSSPFLQKLLTHKNNRIIISVNKNYEYTIQKKW